jgi:RimJ/RimL family protein N-acetyltransferase
MSSLNLLWEKEISVPRLILRRRSSADAEFLQELWAEPGFRNSFNRLLNQSTSTSELKRDLQKERDVPVMQSRQCHWIISNASRKSLGVLSLVDISSLHKRAEVLVGVSSKAPHGTALTAMLILFQFFFNAIKYEKLISFVYPDNGHSLKSTFSLGFQKEGYLRSHLIDPKTNSRHDLVQTGLLREEAFSSRNRTLMKKLLS